MNLWNHQFSKIATEEFEVFLPWKVFKIGSYFCLCAPCKVKAHNGKYKYLAYINFQGRNFQLLFWKINDFINSFRLNLTFSYYFWFLCNIGLYLIKDSYRYGRNTPTLIFENLKPVEISKNHFNIIWTSLKVV